MPDVHRRKGSRLRNAVSLRLWVGLSLLTLLGACTAPELDPSRGLPGGGTQGAVAITLLRSGMRNFNLLFDLRGVRHNLWRVIELRGKGVTLDWDGTAPYPKPAGPEAPLGRLAVLVLPEGDYEIFKWHGESLDGGLHGDGFDIYDDQVSLRFSVKAGVLRNLGVLNIELPDKPDFQADILPRYYTLHRAPARAEHRALLQRRYTGLAGTPTEDTPLQPQGAEKRRYFYVNKQVGDDLRKRRSFH